MFKKFIKHVLNKKEETCIVYLTTFPPRECGLATFSEDLINYSEELFRGLIDIKVVALNLPNLEKKYGQKVIFTISDNQKEEYIKVAEKLNKMAEVKIISIQHEYGIFGPDFG
ncbi:hypothetical protein K2P96_01525, partial [Patescibacteria group bacterium]|nr:hypothetical protein [Patescibacteria group bacterium]